MRILFVGDIVGKGGRRVLREQLSRLQSLHRVDFTIVNVENAAGGFGLTPKLARQMFDLGVDVMTSGNHIWDQKDIYPFLDHQPRLLRPANYPGDLPGKGVLTTDSSMGIPISVISLQGRVFMPSIDCPFRAAEHILARLPEEVTVVVVDFHAEATSEKMAMGWFLDGKVSALIGTHTHVPTADARILPGGTAYMTDAGMSGSYDSVIGMSREGAIERFLTGLPGRLQPETSQPQLSSVVVEVDPADGKARSIEWLGLLG